MKSAAICGSLLFLASTVSALNSSACSYKKFPIYAGGSKDEEVRAIEVDPVSGLIYVGGRTESSNFAPADNPHGYIYSVTPDGDWGWGLFFYNVSYAVGQIDAMVLSSNNNTITVLGQANTKPVLMTLSKSKGQIQKFFTIDPQEPTSKTSYGTYQALHHEEKSPDDNQSYYYLSFQQSIDTARAVHVLKFAVDFRIIWHFSRIAQGSSCLICSVKTPVDDIPRVMSMDNSNPREFYLMGRFRNNPPSTTPYLA
jgi:hypothetical protein